MAVIPAEVQKLFTEVKNVAFATANAQGQPNSCVVAIKTIVDDETIYLSDQLFKKTLANIKENQAVSVLFWDDKEAYQLHGTARYINEGEEFAKRKAWAEAIFASLGMPLTPKGGVFVDVSAVYITTPGPTAGDRIA